jgi:predicted TIM-barrel fold metal-dependent hydrolase
VTLKVPPGATDCHLHIFGPTARYPYTEKRAYTPPEASLEAYTKLSTSLGFERMVIVQPSVYGKDNACTMDMCVAAGPKRARAIVVVDESFSDAQLKEMHDKGARGVRINALTSAGVPPEAIQTLAKRIAPLGWHMQFWISGPQLVALSGLIMSLPVPAVFDHMGQFSLDGGVNNAEFKALLKLLENDHCWVKTVGYRVSKAGPPYEDIRAQAETMIRTAPDRCVWGTDWPHPHLEGRAYPDSHFLLNLMASWAGSEAQAKRILVDNPARLYGF